MRRYESSGLNLKLSTAGNLNTFGKVSLIDFEDALKSLSAATTVSLTEIKCLKIVSYCYVLTLYLNDKKEVKRASNNNNIIIIIINNIIIIINNLLLLNNFNYYNY